MTHNQDINHLAEHLFRHESGKLVAVLTRIFGPEHLGLAEDVVQDALVEAIKHWTYKGIPANPAGWLFKVARNKALNELHREKYKRIYETDASGWLRSTWTAGASADHLFSEPEILDDQLRMMFTCCHPAISEDSQIALILKTLCGFSIPEIAKAFLTNSENIHKRLVRARQKIRESKVPFQIPSGNELESRLRTVLEAIYLLFNEGYSASAGEEPVRYEICEEAIRLTEMMTSHAVLKSQPDIYALLALMQLNASRFRARLDKDGSLLTLERQDRSLYDFPLMQRGLMNLEKAVSDRQFSRYHLLALISSCHCCAPDYESTDWTSILALYDQFVLIDKSPLVFLNRTVAMAKVNGAACALAELEKLEAVPELKNYHHFYSVKADLLIEQGQYATAADLLHMAIILAPLAEEKAFLEKKLIQCQQFFQVHVPFDQG